MISKRAARTAGRNPPIKPIRRENPSDSATIDGDSAKENASSENELKLSVDIEKNCGTEEKSSLALFSSKILQSPR